MPQRDTSGLYGSRLYRSEAGERLVRERYLAFLAHCPVANQQIRVPTREGETFVVASGDAAAPPLFLFHGGVGNAAMWMAEVAAFAAHFRVYAVDMIGEAGLSAPSRPPLNSEAHALWLDDVMHGLGADRAPTPGVALLGVSLGGWLALDYAIRRPERVRCVAVLCPGGVGTQKLGFVIRSIPLLLMGRWGARKLGERIPGRAPKDLPPGAQAFVDFVSLIHRNFRGRRVKLPVFSDRSLQRLTMPVLATVGGEDVLLDSAATKRRLERNAATADVRLIPAAGHLIRGQTPALLQFFLRKEPATRSPS